jgi:serine/threonine protein kinase
MLSAEGHVMLTDFGLSKVAVDARTVCGTIEFMAPEVLNERNNYYRTVDYWSLGIMLYDMLTGSPPFTGSNRKKIMEAVMNKKPIFPRYIVATTRDFITKLLKKDPRVRLGSKGENEIKSHAYFKPINWKKLFHKEILPPFVPEFVNMYFT